MSIFLEVSSIYREFTEFTINATFRKKNALRIKKKWNNAAKTTSISKQEAYPEFFYYYYYYYFCKDQVSRV